MCVCGNTFTVDRQRLADVVMLCFQTMRRFLSIAMSMYVQKQSRDGLLPGKLSVDPHKTTASEECTVLAPDARIGCEVRCGSAYHV